MVWLFVYLLCTNAASAQEAIVKAVMCDNRFIPSSTVMFTDTGGIHITAKGVLRVLIVFASFPDDETPHPFWPAHQPPMFMNQFIDADTSTHSSSLFNLTNYFRQMSLGQLHLVGEAVWVETPHSQEEYRGGEYWRANRQVLQERVDPLVDFSLYDNWTKQADFRHARLPDGQVDMIIMVWRTGIFGFLGEASLGRAAGFILDGKRVEMGFPEYLPTPLGSGVTCQYVYADTPRLLMQTMIHELGHWLLGGPHPYNNDALHDKHAYWGLLCSNQRAASCVNAYERERLGWTTARELQPDTDTPLSDFVTSGVAYKYHPANGEPYEYFYIENHQQVSVFDDLTMNSNEKGIWILHQQGPYMELDNLKMKPSDGSWRWKNPGTTTQCSTQPLPVFEKGSPYPAGLSHRDQIPNSTSALNWLRAFRDPSRTLQCGQFSFGEQFDGSFRIENPVFSAYSNPNTNTWSNQPTSLSMEIIYQLNGVLTLRSISNALDGSPARRYLGNDPTVAQTPPGWISLAWGSQWTEGQPLESDVHWSELQRRIGNNGNWTSVYEGQIARWSDGAIAYDTNGTVPVLFHARVRDAQGKYSVWSNVVYSAMQPSNQVAEGTVIPTRYELKSNYPNPFNPSTTIEYHLPAQSRVTIKILSLLGQEVKTVVDGIENAGVHQSQWDGRNNSGVDAASGVYFYRIEANSIGGANSFARVKKMILLR